MSEFFDDSMASALTFIKLTEEDIVAACSELKTSSAAGADGVPASLLKNCRQELSRPLFILWRASLDQGLIPADLLLVLISPVHKGGSRGLPKNYRPVALTSHIVKVFERVMRRSLVKHLEENGLLPNGQHGFRAFRSTLTQLLSYWELRDPLIKGFDRFIPIIDGRSVVVMTAPQMVGTMINDALKVKHGINITV